MSSQVVTIAQFLLARIAEGEQLARAAITPTAPGAWHQGVDPASDPPRPARRYRPDVPASVPGSPARPAEPVRRQPHRHGDLVLTLHYLAHGGLGSIRIDRADPVIRVAAELLDDMRRGHHHPDVEVTGDLLTIRGSSRTVVYRVGEYDRERDTYLCHWPD